MGCTLLCSSMWVGLRDCQLGGTLSGLSAGACLLDGFVSWSQALDTYCSSVHEPLDTQNRGWACKAGGRWRGSFPYRIICKWKPLGITLSDDNTIDFMAVPLQCQPLEQVPHPRRVWLTWEYSLQGFSLSSALYYTVQAKVIVLFTCKSEKSRGEGRSSAC